MEDSFQASIRYFLEVAARQERIHACPSLMAEPFEILTMLLVCQRFPSIKRVSAIR